MEQIDLRFMFVDTEEQFFVEVSYWPKNFFDEDAMVEKALIILEENGIGRFEVEFIEFVDVEEAEWEGLDTY